MVALVEVERANRCRLEERGAGVEERGQRDDADLPGEPAAELEPVPGAAGGRRRERVGHAPPGGRVRVPLPGAHRERVVARHAGQRHLRADERRASRVAALLDEVGEREARRGVRGRPLRGGEGRHHRVEQGDREDHGDVAALVTPEFSQAGPCECHVMRPS